MVSVEAPVTIDALYATRVRTAGGWLVELAGSGDPAALAKSLMPKGERIEVYDAARGQMRIAVLEDSRLKAALYISKTGGLPSREWLAAQLEAADAPSTVALLAARPAKPAADRGPLLSVRPEDTPVGHESVTPGTSPWIPVP